MDWIAYLVSLVVTGLIVGALGRLVVPGPNPMSIPATIGIGILGALLGGLPAPRRIEGEKRVLDEVSNRHGEGAAGGSGPLYRV